MSLDIRVVSDGPLYERLMARRDQERPGYTSAHTLFLVTPFNYARDTAPSGVFCFPILIGLYTGPPGERIHKLAERLLEATLRFISVLDGGQPNFLEVPDLDALWPPKP